MKITLTRFAMLGGLCTVLLLKSSVGRSDEPSALAAPLAACPYLKTKSTSDEEFYQHSHKHLQLDRDLSELLKRRSMLDTALQGLAQAERPAGASSDSASSDSAPIVELCQPPKEEEESSPVVELCQPPKVEQEAPVVDAGAHEEPFAEPTVAQPETKVEVKVAAEEVKVAVEPMKVVEEAKVVEATKVQEEPKIAAEVKVVEEVKVEVKVEAKTPCAAEEGKLEVAREVESQAKPEAPTLAERPQSDVPQGLPAEEAELLELPMTETDAELADSVKVGLDLWEELGLDEADLFGDADWQSQGGAEAVAADEGPKAAPIDPFTVELPLLVEAPKVEAVAQQDVPADCAEQWDCFAHERERQGCFAELQGQPKRLLLIVEDPRHSAGAEVALELNAENDGLAPIAATPEAVKVVEAAPAEKIEPTPMVGIKAEEAQIAEAAKELEALEADLAELETLVETLRAADEEARLAAEAVKAEPALAESLKAEPPTADQKPMPALEASPEMTRQDGAPAVSMPVNVAPAAIPSLENAVEPAEAPAAESDPLVEQALRNVEAPRSLGTKLAVPASAVLRLSIERWNLQVDAFGTLLKHALSPRDQPVESIDE